MKKLIKWIAILLGSILALLTLTAAGLYTNTGLQLNKSYSISETLPIPTDAASIQHGQHLANIYCTFCHGANLSGREFINDPALGRIDALNLTPGKGGAGAEFSDGDWVRAIRYGVNPEGKSLMVMPTSSYFDLTDKDLGDLIAYLKTLPPVDAEWQDPHLTPMARILISTGAFGRVISAQEIDPNRKRPAPVTPGVTAAYGEYLTKTAECHTCHGPGLEGGKAPDPKSPAAPNLTRGGEMKGWTEAQFMQVARTWSSEFMPWPYLNGMTDGELKAVWLYLQSLPAR